MPKNIKEFENIDIVDWSKVKPNTKVLVSDDGVNWVRAYFVDYINNEVYVYCEGRNSINTNYSMSWKYTKLQK